MLRTMTTARSGSTSQPSQVANAGRSGIDTDPGMCPAAKSGTGRTSTTRRPRPAPGPPRPAKDRSSVGDADRRGAAAVDLAEAGESTAGSCRATPAAGVTNASSSGAVSSALRARSGPMVEVRSAPGGAEQNEPAPWVGHTATSSPAGQPLQRPVLRAGQLLGPLRVDQVGPGRRTHDQRPAGEHPERPRPVERSRTPRARGCAPESAAPAGSARPGRPRHRHPGRGAGSPPVPAAEARTRAPSPRASSDRPGEEIGVQMGVGGVRDPQPAPWRRPRRMPRRSRRGVHRQCAAVAQVEQVRASCPAPRRPRCAGPGPACARHYIIPRIFGMMLGGTRWRLPAD